MDMSDLGRQKTLLFIHGVRDDDSSANWRQALDAALAPLGRRKMHVRVKFVDGRAGSRDTARHPFEGQPHGGSRRAKCPHLVDIRGEGLPNARWVCLGPEEPTDSRSARADSAPAWERPAERGSPRPETAPRPAARRYEARSLKLELANRIESGNCHVNDTTVYDEPQMAFGGVKASGFGRFGGRAALEEFTELRWITVQDLPRQYPI